MTIISSMQLLKFAGRVPAVETTYSNLYPSFINAYPTDRTFTKQRDNSELWILTMIDHRNNLTNAINFVRASLDNGLRTQDWAADFSRGGALDAHTYAVNWSGIPAGVHTIDIQAAVSAGTATWSTSVDVVQVYEIDGPAILVGTPTLAPFATVNPSLIPTGFPQNNMFTKELADSEIWAFMNIGHMNSVAGATNTIGMVIDNSAMKTFANDFAKGGNFKMETMIWNIKGLSAGQHSFDVEAAASSGTTGTFFVNNADLSLYEVAIV